MHFLSIDEQIDKITHAIKATSTQVQLSLIPSINRTADWFKSNTSREIAKAKGLKLNKVRSKIFIKRANGTTFFSTLNYNVKGVLAADLGILKQTKSGVVVGGRLFDGAFIAHFRKDGKPGVYKRKTKKRFPLMSVRVSIDKEVSDAINRFLGTEAKFFFEKRFIHEIRRVTGTI